MKTIKNFIEITENMISKQEVDDTINFASPLAITDDSRQWNMTKYDIPTLDISHYDGIVTVNHGQNISDVIGKVVNLRKDEQGHKVLIDGIKFALNANPVAVLAKNLMKDGFVTGVSIETIGNDPDSEGTWLNHKLCGLSVVAHPNNLNAYATISNSIKEAKTYGFDTTKLENMLKQDEKSIYFFDKKEYNNNMESAKKLVEKNSKRLNKIITERDAKLYMNSAQKVVVNFNPWHDELGRFAEGPAAAIHATTIYTAERCKQGSSEWISAAYDSGSRMGIGIKGNLVVEGKVDVNGHPTIQDGYGTEAEIVSDKFTPEMAATILTVNSRFYEIQEKYKTPIRKTPDPVDKVIYDSSSVARSGKLNEAQISALQKIANAKTRAGSKMESKKSDAADVLAMNNTMKYLNKDIEAKGAKLDFAKIKEGKASLEGLTAYSGSYSSPEKLGSVRYLKNGELFTSTRGDKQLDYHLAARDKRFDNEIDNLKIGSVYRPENGEPDVRFETGFSSMAKQVQMGNVTVSSEQYMNAQRTVFEDYQAELKKFLKG